MAVPLGNECRLFYGVAGDTTPTIAITKVEDVTLELDATEIDQTTRDDGGWRAKRSGLRQWGVSFRKLYNSNYSQDSSFVALRDAFKSGSPISIAVLDGESDVGLGVRGDVYVTKFSRGEPMDDVVRIEITLVGNGQPTVD